MNANEIIADLIARRAALIQRAEQFDAFAPDKTVASVRAKIALLNSLIDNYMV